MRAAPILFVVLGALLGLTAASCATSGECTMPGSTTCQAPPLGWVDDSGACKLCAPGTYTPSAGAACIAPPANASVAYDAAGIVVCTGNTVPASPPTTCEPCPVGHHPSEHHEFCEIAVALSTSTGTHTLFGTGFFERAEDNFKSIIYVGIGAAVLVMVAMMAVAVTALKNPEAVGTIAKVAAV